MQVNKEWIRYDSSYFFLSLLLIKCIEYLLC